MGSTKRRGEGRNGATLIQSGPWSSSVPELCSGPLDDPEQPEQEVDLSSSAHGSHETRLTGPLEADEPPEDRRAKLVDALPENPRTAHYGAVERARTLIVAIADAAWTLVDDEGNGPEAREAERLIERAMSCLDGRKPGTHATIALIDAIAAGARAIKNPEAKIEDADNELTAFWWDWPEFAGRLDIEVYRNAVCAWSAGGSRPNAARWQFVQEAVTGAGLPPQARSTVLRLWRRSRSSRRPRGT
jgi:hypothetical protein